MRQTPVINEIMYDPLAGRPEWIELYNPSERAVDIRGWQLSDSDTTRRIVITMIRESVPPSGFAVIAGNSSLPDFYTAWEGAFLVHDRFPRLNNDADAVVLFDSSGQVVDRVDYRRQWGGRDGISLEKIHPKLCGNQASNWGSCTRIAGATPGHPNSIVVESLSTEAVLAADPNPFSPDADGYEDVTTISYRLPMATSCVNLRIYDLRGRRIRSLLSAAFSGSSNAVVWDGTDDENRTAKIGIYIVMIEGLDSATGLTARAKTTVIVAGVL